MRFLECRAKLGALGQALGRYLEWFEASFFCLCLSPGLPLRWNSGLLPGLYELERLALLFAPAAAYAERPL